ncbi:hypothetical protein SKAU_G00035340 [Synaphobranchus kaupii]|uniref:Uncharacterized protein n=1 Tax=Synaphobranchus kaupii TaxID=118154 RepID=A0A9Q1GEF2_SYNKA|nr:hypothetical protein SKAU_G00035340 [Synaphobranchus kaupii]
MPGASPRSPPEETKGNGAERPQHRSINAQNNDQAKSPWLPACLFPLLHTEAREGKSGLWETQRAETVANSKCLAGPTAVFDKAQLAESDWEWVGSERRFEGKRGQD